MYLLLHNDFMKYFVRTIHFFDASASVHYEEYRGFGLKNIPLCIDYWFDPKDPDGESLLMFGDDGGSLTIIRFSQPPNSLFKKDEVDSVQTLFWSNMDKHSEFALVQYNQVCQNLFICDGPEFKSNQVENTPQSRILT